MTNIAKYGVSCVMNTPERIAKRKLKWEDFNYVRDLITRRKQTCMERYGVDHPAKIEPSIQQVAKALNVLRRYLG
jgi:hypothetical protein